ncbi:MAG: T9SS type A sorting domain-containing protein [Melioribacteraceae bacterium]|nr:T9SS type A sorting domain-containing protein [Melioribacteraceae bacterium]MCF8355817.1 T9SS type A sorting domain-containing protein [Melioribacteraceae bacterium]MCF8395290.1 T9SS type A sorting domain-containing protein [Melioribacteraceae bacterium]MCF8420723.1 T9SS type A sorting domain-containing protein [Melioribacteraceae bacterium]
MKNFYKKLFRNNNSLLNNQDASLLTILLFLFLTTNTTYTQWSTDPNENLEVNPWGVFVTACSDGEGGAFIGWKNFDYYYTRAYLQYVDKYGYVQWDEPLMILDKGDLQYEPYLLEDGEGNCIAVIEVKSIVGYDEDEFPIYDSQIHLQKIKKTKEIVWDSTGVKMTLNEWSQSIPAFTTNQKGGVLLNWFEVVKENEEYRRRFHVQHISSSGERMWSDTGKVIMDSITSPINPMAVSDGAGGMIVYYGDKFHGNNTYFERIDFFGNSLWKRASPTHNYRQMTGLEGNGAVFIGGSEDHPTSGENLFVNIINNEGECLIEGEGKIYADSVNRTYIESNITFTKNTGLISLGWSSIGVDEIEQIYYQLVNLNGEFLFNQGGKQISEYQSNKYNSRLINSGNNLIIMWRDERDSSLSYSSIFSQKVDTLGNRLWQEDDVALSFEESTIWTIIEDKNNGAILVRSRDPHWGVYAQQINKNGELGIVTKVVNEEENLANKIELLQNYPNPFNPNTNIKFFLEIKEYVELTVYNLLGEKITTLFEDYAEPGTNIVTWNGTDSRGKKQASGVYLITLQAGSYRHTIKSLLIK